MAAVALTIAGSDPSGGAGIQADLKTFHQFGVYGEAAITLLTVQNTKAVFKVHVLPAALVREQIAAVVSDIPPQAAKTGALGSVEIVMAVVEAAADFQFPLVVDPVMISKHGHRLVSAQAEQAIREKLLPCCALVTPNIPEAEVLSGIKIDTEQDVREAGKRILDLGARAVLIKGGHLAGEPFDFLYPDRLFPGHRIPTVHTHGTGCTYSAAITAGLAQGLALPEAIGRAKDYIQRAIETAPGMGAGQGPVNHFAAI